MSGEHTHEGIEELRTELSVLRARVDSHEVRIEALESTEPPVPEPPDPPAGDWPDPFMSYPASQPIRLVGVRDRVIEHLAFDGLAWPAQPIVLDNCDNVTIRRVDFRRSSIGVYAVNSRNITIEYCRAENITGPSERTGANRANFYQFNNVDGFHCHHLKGRYGDTEDVFSHYASRNGVLEDVAWEGAVRTDQPTSDSTPSIPWRSNSGTGAICGDGGGNNSRNVQVRRATFLNPGQVGIAIAGGQNCSFTDCVVVSNANPPTRQVNVAAYVWNQYSGTCAGHVLRNNRTRFHNNNNFWNGGNCGSVDTQGSVWGDMSLNPADYRVTL